MKRRMVREDCAPPARVRQRTLNVASYDGWQRGVRVDGRDAVQVAVQERVGGEP